MNVYEAVLKRRSIRKFKQQDIDINILKQLVNAGRLAPHGANIQALKYIIINEKKLVQLIFKETKWAGYLYPNGTPKEGQRPVSYIAILCDTKIQNSGWNVNVGAAGENIILTALEQGIGSCWLGAINRENIKEILNVPNKFYIHSLIALGYPNEEPIIEDENGDIKYYKDSNDILHVPKRKIENIIFYNKLIKGDMPSDK